MSGFQEKHKTTYALDVIIYERQHGLAVMASKEERGGGERERERERFTLYIYLW